LTATQLTLRRFKTLIKRS